MNEQKTKVDQGKKTAPYPLSWVDWLFAWIDRLPGSPWVFYLIVFLLLSFAGHAVYWLDGSLPAGAFEPARVVEQSLLLYFPVLMQYLNGSARRALQTFKPVLQVEEAEVDRLAYELTTLPRSSGIAAGIVGLVFGPISVLSQPGNWGLFPSSSWLTFAYAHLNSIVSLAFVTAFILHTTRQLRVVSSIHRMAGNINLFEMLPVYAFSNLTVRTGIGIVVVFYYYIYTFFVIQLFGPYQGSPMDLFFVFLMLLVAAGSFVLPLNGMHRRLIKEKTRLLAETTLRFERTLSRLHQQLDAGRLDDMDGLNKAIASLVIERDALSKISTWPWKPETFRGFLTSMVLPIMLWMITTFLGRWLGP